MFKRRKGEGRYFSVGKEEEIELSRKEGFGV